MPAPVSAKSPESQLDSFLDKFSPEIAAEARAALLKMRERLPGAVEMVYDNYNALVSGFGPTERASEAIFSIAIFPNWVTLCFLQGAGLPDPNNLLRGQGNQVRHIRLGDVSDLDKPPIKKLMAEALKHAAVPIDKTKRSRLIIKSISAKQRPRRTSK